MEGLIKANSPAEQVTIMNTLLNETNEAIQKVLESNTVLNEKALQLRNHEMAVAESGTLGHVKVSTDLVVDPVEKTVSVNPVVVDSKVAAHAADTTAHGDIRETLETIPKVISNFTVTGPGTVKTGVTNTFQFGATPLLPDSYINRVDVALPDGSTLAKSGVNVINNTASFDFALIGEDMTSQVVKVYFTDNFGSKSEVNEYSIYISTNNAPVMTNLVVNGLGTHVAPGAQYTLNFTGGTDADGDALTYSITNVSDPSKLLFSKTTSIASGSNVTLSVDAGISRGQAYSFTVVGSDGRFGGTASKSFTFNTNVLPTTTGITLLNVPSFIAPGQSYTVALDNASETDADGQTITYSLTANDANITFTPTANLHEFTMAVGALAPRNASIDITLRTNDGLEDGATKLFTAKTKVNILPDISAFAHTVPSKMYPGQVASIAFTGITDTTLIGGLSISLVSNTDDFIFGKTSGINVGESISLTCAAGATRGANTTITLSVTDGVETITTNVVTSVNQLINTAGLTLSNLPPFITNDATYEMSVSGAVDTDGQSLTYSIASNVPAAIIYSKHSGLVANEEFTVYTDGLTQNTTVTFTVSVSDGMETVTKDFTTVVNSIPISANIEMVLPTVIKPNTTYNNVVVYGGSDVDAAQTLSYSISCSSPEVTFSKSSALAANETFNINVGAVARASVVTFTVTVSDGVDTSTRNFNKTINSLPNTTNVVVNGLPSVVKPSSTTSISVSGATEVDSQTISYSITCDKSYVSFSKSTGLSAGENFNLIYGSDAVRGETPVLTVIATDGLENSTAVTVNAPLVNSLPDVSGVVATGLNTTPTALTQYSFSLSGATDVNGGALSYNITDTTGFTFGATTGIAAGATVTFTASGVSVDTARTFKVYAVDSYGEVSATSKDFTVTVKPKLMPVAPTILAPTANQQITLPFNIQLSAYATTPQL